MLLVLTTKQNNETYSLSARSCCSIFLILFRLTLIKSKMLKKFTILFGSLVILLALGNLQTAECAMPWEQEQRWDQWFLDRHNLFVQNTQNNRDNINVLFYGDSITEAWEWTGREPFDQFYSWLGTANYGIGSDQTQNVNWRIYNGETQGLHPKVIVLKIGTNNLGYNDNDIVAGVISVVNNLRYMMPNAKILLLGVLPRNNADVNNRVRYINSQIQTVADGWNIRFLDMFDTFCKGNDQFEYHLYDPDLLHLSTAGYWAWAQTMAPTFNEMMQS